jgi:hypothetical protein
MVFIWFLQRSSILCKSRHVSSSCLTRRTFKKMYFTLEKWRAHALHIFRIEGNLKSTVLWFSVRTCLYASIYYQGPSAIDQWWLVYEGPLTKPLQTLKRVSLTSTGLTLVSLPVLLTYTEAKLSLMAQVLFFIQKNVDLKPYTIFFT